MNHGRTLLPQIIGALTRVASATASAILLIGCGGHGSLHTQRSAATTTATQQPQGTLNEQRIVDAALVRLLARRNITHPAITCTRASSRRFLCQVDGAQFWSATMIDRDTVRLQLLGSE